MVMSVAPPRVHDLGWPTLRRSWLEVRLDQHRKSGNTMTLATIGVTACSVIVPAMGVFRVIVNSGRSEQVVPAIIATAAFLPLQVWLVLAAVRGRSAAAHRWALAAMAVLIVAMLPVVGAPWLGALFPLSALVLVVMPRPVGATIFAALVLLAIPLAHLLHQPKLSEYFATGTLMHGLGVAVPIWLLAAIREWQQARYALADEAVVMERMRIDQELRPIVGASLTTIAARGQQAAAQVEHNRAAAATQLRELVEGSRRTLADVRRLIRGYQAVSLWSEVRTALGLLEAAGVTTTLRVGKGDIPPVLSPAQRQALHADLTALLADADRIGTCVCTVSVHNGAAQVALIAGLAAAPASTTGAA